MFQASSSITSHVSYQEIIQIPVVFVTQTNGKPCPTEQATTITDLECPISVIETSRPIAVAMANEHNAAGFRAFSAAVYENYKGNFDQAITDYERFCAASGKS